jgi:hypothetical protein
MRHTTGLFGWNGLILNLVGKPAFASTPDFVAKMEPALQDPALFQAAGLLTADIFKKFRGEFGRVLNQ